MNLPQTLRLIEDLYSHRFGKKESTSFHEAIVDFFHRKCKTKQAVDQGAFDLLASTDQLRQTSVEVALFYQFLTQELTHKELLYFLLLRNLAEREMSIMITKLPSNQDIRSIKITKLKCLKIAKLYFSNVMAVSNDPGTLGSAREMKQVQ